MRRAFACVKLLALSSINYPSATIPRRGLEGECANRRGEVQMHRLPECRLPREFLNDRGFVREIRLVHVRGDVMCSGCVAPDERALCIS